MTMLCTACGGLVYSCHKDDGVVMLCTECGGSQYECIEEEQPKEQDMPDELNERDNLTLETVETTESLAGARTEDSNGEAGTWARQTLKLCRAWRHLRTAFGATLNQRDEARRGMVRLAFSSSTKIEVSGTGFGEPGRYTVRTQFEAAAVWWGIEVATKMFGEPGPNWAPPKSQPMPLTASEPPPE